MKDPDLRKYSINNPVRKGVVAISNEVLFINQKIMISIELPKLAIYHVKVFVRKVSAAKNKVLKDAAEVFT